MEVKCRRCNRGLTREPYRSLGVGEICAAKLGIEVPVSEDTPKKKVKKVKHVRKMIIEKGRRVNSWLQMEIPFKYFSPDSI